LKKTKPGFLSILLLLSGAVSFLATGAMQRIAFERDDTIWISNADGTGAKKLADGNLPDISPDGTRIAFNTNEPGTRSPVRHIAVVEIASGDLTVFKDIPSDNCFGPIWSPDGSALLFNIYMEDDWQLGFVKSDGSEFRIVKKRQRRADRTARPAGPPMAVVFLP
jgi:TolB protein